MKWPFRKKSEAPAEPPKPVDKPFPAGTYSPAQMEAEAKRWGMKFICVMERKRLFIAGGTKEGDDETECVIICERVDIPQPEAPGSEAVN